MKCHILGVVTVYQNHFGALGDGLAYPSCAKTTIFNRPSQIELLTEVLKRRMEQQVAEEIAAKLINRLGDVKHVLRACPQQLAKILEEKGLECKGWEGKGMIAIEAIEETRMLLHRLVEDNISERPLLEEVSAVTQYCRSFLSGERREQFHLLMLDRDYFLLAHERLQVGTIDHVAVYPREVIATALSNNAVSIILVHNHPGGCARPSAADISTTRLIVKAGQYVGVDVTDHIIVGSKSDFSFRTAGLLPLTADRLKFCNPLKPMSV